MELQYKWEDIFKAGRLGVNPRKISVGVKGLFYGVLLYSVLSYIALVVSGWQIKEIWQTFRFIPAPFVKGNLNLIGIIIYIIACLGTLFFYLVTLTAISKITFEQLKGDEFYEAKEAWSFAWKNWKGAFGSPLFLAIAIFCFLLVGVVMALIVRLPHVGPIFISLFSFPLIGGAFLIVYLTIVTMVVLIAGPAIVGTTNSDTFDTVFEGFSLINDQTWRFLLWEVILLLFTLICTFILAYLAKKALWLTNIVFTKWGGKNWPIMWGNAKWLLYIPNFFPIIVGKFFPSIVFPNVEFVTEGVAKSTLVASFILGLTLYLIVFIVLGYGLSVLGSGQTVIYTILVKFKDKKDLLEEKEELFGEEVKEEEKKEEEKEKKATPKRRVRKKKAEKKK
ncbi:MAG: hypothetical protein ABIN61_04070 [candidate division WOR-3 bacterium]